MDLFWAIVLFLVAFLLLIKGGDFLVESSIWLAKKTKISPIIIGATIVSLATTLPEVLVSTFATLKGSDAYGMAVGNAAGSMIANIGLILGLSALFAPSKVTKEMFFSKGVILLIVTAVFLTFCYTGAVVTLLEGIILLLLFVAFMALNIWQANNNRKNGNELENNLEQTKADSDGEKGAGDKIWQHVLFFVFGAVFIAFGADMLVNNGMKIALAMGVSSELMGVTFVALGTSLPELVTTISSIRKKETSLGIGNILGANIINSTLLVGISGVIAGATSGLTITYSSMLLTLPAVAIITAIMVVPCLVGKRTFRAQGAILILSYFLYMALTVCNQLGVF